VLKKIASISSLVLALTLLAAPVCRLYAQSTVPPATPNTVTGGDPEPNEQTAALSVLLPILVTL
jgi:hypothetical protein